MAADASTPWDASEAIAHCPVGPWTGVVWRYHARKYSGDDAAGSLKATGRFHRGSDKFPASETWMALYTSLAPQVALGERLRHTQPSTLGKLANQRQSRLRVELQTVLDLCNESGCSSLNVSGLSKADLCRPRDYERCHQIAHAARARAEAMLVPSCTNFPEGNLILFPDRLLPGSGVSIEETVDPDLFIDWDQFA